VVDSVEPVGRSSSSSSIVVHVGRLVGALGGLDSMGGSCGEDDMVGCQSRPRFSEEVEIGGVCRRIDRECR
jgi:hypothetical protein